jgi:hypothetical protein
MEEIVVIREYDDLPYIVKSEDGQIYQLSYYDTKKRLKQYKVLIPKNHNGSMYYRIEGQRFSEYRLKTMERKVYKRINLNKIRK